MRCRGVALAARSVLAGALALAASGADAAPERVVVRTTAQLRAAVGRAAAGTTVAVAPGVYEGGLFVSGLAGRTDAPIVIEGADPADPPIIRGGANGFQFSDVRHLVLRHLIFERQTQNGINIDDAETFDTPSRHVTLSHLAIRDVLNTGTGDGIKLSGVQDFVIEDSTIERWGAGSAVDMVGCHRGLLRRNVFRHADDKGATGPQMKGGSTGITVRGNRFEHAGLRAVQIGGTTSLRFFRPAPAPYEARDCVVEHNVFVGSEAAVTFVNVDGAIFRRNTVYRPRRWLLRVLQESTGPAFVPSRRGLISGNIVVFHGAEMPNDVVNAGHGTEPASFRFERNWWYRIDQPGASRPSLPAAEVDGTYGRDPQFEDPGGGDYRVRPGSPAGAHGASPDAR